MLLAEDSVTMQQLVTMTLSTTDVDITLVASGREALAKANEMRPDLILADMSMPDMDGFEVCEALKSDPATAAIPVLLLGGAGGVDEQRVAAVGADGIIGKPFESQLLIERVRQLAQAAEGQGHAAAVTAQPAQPPRPATPVVGALPQASPPAPAPKPATPSAPTPPAPASVAPTPPAPAAPTPAPPTPIQPVTQPLTPVASPHNQPEAPPPLPEQRPPQPLSQPSAPEPVRPTPTPKPAIPAEPAPITPMVAEPEPAPPVAAPATPERGTPPSGLGAVPASSTPFEAAPVTDPDPPVFGGPDDTGWEPDLGNEKDDGMWGASDGLWDDVDKAVAETAAPNENTGSHGPDLWGEEGPPNAEDLDGQPPLEGQPADPPAVVHTAAELANLEAFGEPDTSPSGLELAEPEPSPVAPPAFDEPEPEPEPAAAPIDRSPAAVGNGNAALDGIPAERLEAIVRDVARSILERIAWEVVPDLAEEIIKDEIDRLTK